MNTHREQDLRIIIQEHGEVEITIVNFDTEESKEIIIKTDYFDEAKSEIEGYEIEHEVYF